MSNYTPPLNMLAAAPSLSNKPAKAGTWFEAMAQAWGQALDNQASKIEQQSDIVAGGTDTPSAITELSTQSLRMGFLSNSSHTSISSVGSALETMARKQ